MVEFEHEPLLSQSNFQLVVEFVIFRVQSNGQMKIEYNAPIILTYALLASIILLVQQLFFDIMPLFTVYPEVSFTDPVWYFRLFSHALGHGDWNHLVSNFTIILLVGPILEEKYGSRDLLIMIVVTAFVIGLLQVFFFSTALLGASGIAFMLILLASYTRTRSGGIPLSFLLIVLLFLGKEIYQSFDEDQVSQFAHIIGGVLGGVFGFIWESGSGGKNNKVAVKEDVLTTGI